MRTNWRDSEGTYITAKQAYDILSTWRLEFIRSMLPELDIETLGDVSSYQLLAYQDMDPSEKFNDRLQAICELQSACPN